MICQLSTRNMYLDFCESKGGIHHRSSDLWISWTWIEMIGGSDPRLTAIRLHQNFSRWTPIERSPIIMWSCSTKSARWLASFDTVSCCHSVSMCRYFVLRCSLHRTKLLYLHYYFLFWRHILRNQLLFAQLQKPFKITLFVLYLVSTVQIVTN